MNLETVSDKHLHELERLAGELLAVIRQAKLLDEPVTEALLDATVARTVDGAVQIAELRAGTRAPIHRPAHQCRWCPVLSTCDVGRRWLADEDIPVPQPDEA